MPEGGPAHEVEWGSPRVRADGHSRPRQSIRCSSDPSSSWNDASTTGPETPPGSRATASSWRGSHLLRALLVRRLVAGGQRADELEPGRPQNHEHQGREEQEHEPDSELDARL